MTPPPALGAGATSTAAGLAAAPRAALDQGGAVQRGGLDITQIRFEYITNALITGTGTGT
jgi:hypothetical protein